MNEKEQQEFRDEGLSFGKWLESWKADKDIQSQEVIIEAFNLVYKLVVNLHNRLAKIEENLS
jgi:hypothetical protein